MKSGTEELKPIDGTLLQTPNKLSAAAAAGNDTSINSLRLSDASPN